jgi:hypothetical protein
VPDVHGVAGYARKCRCTVCRAANAARCRQQTEKRVARAAEDPSLIPHGRGGYTNWECRCDVCTTANTQACIAYRRARKANRKETVI